MIVKYYICIEILNWKSENRWSATLNAACRSTCRSVYFVCNPAGTASTSCRVRKSATSFSLSLSLARFPPIFFLYWYPVFLSLPTPSLYFLSIFSLSLSTLSVCISQLFSLSLFLSRFLSFVISLFLSFFLSIILSHGDRTRISTRTMDYTLILWPVSYFIGIWCKRGIIIWCCIIERKFIYQLNWKAFWNH